LSDESEGDDGFVDLSDQSDKNRAEARMLLPEENASGSPVFLAEHDCP
jgi:hypothetical protein